MSGMTPYDSPLMPVFFKLEGTPVLVVGAGSVATEKIETLLDTGARITVIAPEATDEVRAAATSGRLAWCPRAYRSGDVIGYRIVVVSTADREINESVSRDARSWSIPVNVVDVPELCDFYFGSIVRRGPVTVAISTSGASPALASRLRRFLDRVLPQRLDRLARALALTRPVLLRSIPGFRDRARAVDRLLDDLPLLHLDDRSDQEIHERVGAWIQEVRS